MIPEYRKNEIITTGCAIINSTNISQVENNHYEKIGNVVSFSFTVTTKKQLDNTDEIFTGLPKAKELTRFIGACTGNGDSVVRLAITKTGRIVNQYSINTIFANKIIEGHVVYICE